MATVRYTVVDGEVIAEKRNGVRSLYVPDPLGSTVALLDNTQAQTDTFTYWPYGEENVRTGTTPTPFRFVGTKGYYRDSASKTYVRARHLDTQKSRWLTQDPIGHNTVDSNLYRYVFNRPMVLTDRIGMQPLDCPWCYGLQATYLYWPCITLCYLTRKPPPEKPGSMRGHHCQSEKSTCDQKCSGKKDACIASVTVAAVACAVKGNPLFCAGSAAVGYLACSGVYADCLSDCLVDFNRCLRLGGTND
jgi:RHS repeat-associated protein